MTRLTLVLAITAGTTVSATAWVILRPPRRLRGRVAPYVQVVRTRLLRGVDPETYLTISRSPARVRDAFEPLIERLSRIHSRVLGPRDEEQLVLRLRQSGLYPGMEATDRLRAFRNRSFATAAAVAAILGAIGWQSQGGVGLMMYATGGFVLGSFLAKGRVDRAIDSRRRRIRSELYTVNQILAMRARVGGGVGDALRHVAQRGRGVIVSEVQEILRLVRTGTPTTEALRRAAANTAEPEAARLYHSLAIGQERGVDLADSLLALSKDLRVARRDEAVTKAATRRIAAVIPIVVILAPIAIAFMAAPLPSLIFGGGSP
ncbi:MAG TPA: type II secretion system F family protein [Acidimicrobiia bacterium]|nr:type II secretion system F family protein [Acidimicrobiia bacterium]